MNQLELNEIVTELARDDLDTVQDWIDKHCRDVAEFLDLQLVSGPKGTPWTVFLPVNSHFRAYREAHYLRLSTILDLTAHVISPLEVAAAFGAQRSLSWLWRHPDTTGRHKRLILHAVLLGFGMECITEECGLQLTRTIVDWCQTSQGTGALRLIVLAENRQGFRPLELAIQIGAYGIFKSLLEIPSIYRTSNVLSGALRLAIFDLSEYSPFTTFPRANRYWKSPLRILATSPNTFLPIMESSKILTHPVIKDMILTASRRNLLHIVVKALLTLLLSLFWPGVLITRIYHKIYQSNSAAMLSNSSSEGGGGEISCQQQPLASSRCCNKEGEDRYAEWMSVLHLNHDNADLPSAVWVSLFLYISVILKNEFAKLVIYRNQAIAYHINASDSCITGRIKFVFKFILKFVILFGMGAIISLVDEYQGESPRYEILTLDIFSICLSLVLLIELFNCLALIPRVGVPIFMFLQSLETLLPFLIIYFMALTIYGILFLQRMPCLDFEAFAGTKNWILSAIYSVFRMTLNLLDFPREHTFNLWLLQIFVVILIPIFILNFIIAVVNSNVQFVSDHIETLFLLNQLETVLEFDSFFRLPGLNLNWYYKGFCRTLHSVVFVNVKSKNQR